MITDRLPYRITGTRPVFTVRQRLFSCSDIETGNFQTCPVLYMKQRTKAL